MVAVTGGRPMDVYESYKPDDLHAGDFGKNTL